MRAFIVLLALAGSAGADVPTAGGNTGLGTAHPVRLLAAAPDGHWAALCEARKDTNKDGRITVGPGFNGLYGDDMQAFLVIGSGPGQAIDDRVASDASGRYLVLLRKGKLVLLDVTTLGEVDLSKLGAYAKAKRDATGAYLGVSFDAAGKHLSYVVLRKKQPLIVVRDLAAGSEVTVQPGTGKLWSAQLDPSGTRLLIEALPPRADHRPTAFPTFRWPDSFRELGCHTRVVGDVFHRTGDLPIMRIAPASGGPAVDAPGYLTTLGDALLSRAEGGAIVLTDGAGAHELLPASCKGIVDRADAAGHRLLAHCTAEGDAAPELLVGVKATRDLGFKAGNSTDDSFEPFGRHLFWSRRDADDSTLDLETGKRRTSPFNQREQDHLGARTLLSRHQRLILLDGAAETDLGDLGTEYPKMLSAGTVRYLEGLVVDLATGKLVGVAPQRDMRTIGDGLVKVTATVLAVASDGRLLGTFKNNPSGFPDGPLEWLAPAAPPPPPTPPPPAKKPTPPAKPAGVSK